MIGTKNSQICHRNNAMSTLTAEIGSSVNTSQRYEHFYRRNQVKCNQHFKISPCFWDREEAATKEASGLGRRKHIRRGTRRKFGEDEATSTTGPRLGKQTPATSSTAHLEEEDDDDEQQHPCADETEEEQPTQSHARPVYDPAATMHCRTREEATAPRRVESRRE